MTNVWKLWIILVYCCTLTRYLTVVATTSRHKRTIGMFENFIETMRQTFTPAQSQSVPTKVIVWYPWSSKYAYYPTTMRMRITPIEPAMTHRHVIVVRTMPLAKQFLAAPEIRIVRRIQPVTTPPTKTTTIVRYEPVPLTVLHSDPANELPIAHPLLLDDEGRAASAWAMDDSALTPVKAYDPLSTTLDSDQEMWNMHALSSPVLADSPEWSSVPTHMKMMGNSYSIPMEKRILIPGRSKKEFARHRT